jgi:hypothetical protein
VEKRKNSNMDRLRFQGLYNILRFNWPLYAGAVATAAIAAALGVVWLAWLLMAMTMVSLLASLYVYDLSGLYRLAWLPGVARGSIINIHAGFDEMSGLLKTKFPACELKVFDFYHRLVHPAASIARARKVGQVYPGTLRIRMDQLPLEGISVERIYLIFAAHEIRDKAMRDVFFRELGRVLKADGQIVLVEHLRDWRNFMVYTAGAWHFLPAEVWRRTFVAAGLTIREERWVNFFVKMYVLRKKEMEFSDMAAKEREVQPGR